MPLNPGEKLPFSVALGDFGLVLHGGAGAPAKLSEKDYARFTHTMNAALSTGWKALRDEASSLTAVLDAVKILEDSPLFNAGGLGVVLDNEGHARTDAGIMRGDTLKAGGVAHVRGVANPSQLARLVMDKSAALLLCGDGAEKFAIANGIEVHQDEKHFVLPERLEQLLTVQARGLHMSTDHDAETEREKIGTVGVVAIDRAGNIAAVTSTGGRVNKPVGRIGDSPIPGCGVWADNASLGVSGTGVGEAFLMSGAAKFLANHYQQSGNLNEALYATLQEIQRFDGNGGLICISKEKVAAWDFNTPAMFRGYIGDDGQAKSFVYLEI